MSAVIIGIMRQNGKFHLIGVGAAGLGACLMFAACQEPPPATGTAKPDASTVPAGTASAKPVSELAPATQPISGTVELWEAQPRLLVQGHAELTHFTNKSDTLGVAIIYWAKRKKANDSDCLLKGSDLDERTPHVIIPRGEQDAWFNVPNGHVACAVAAHGMVLLKWSGNAHGTPGLNQEGFAAVAEQELCSVGHGRCERAKEAVDGWCDDGCNRCYGEDKKEACRRQCNGEAGDIQGCHKDCDASYERAKSSFDEGSCRHACDTNWLEDCKRGCNNQECRGWCDNDNGWKGGCHRGCSGKKNQMEADRKRCHEGCSGRENAREGCYRGCEGRFNQDADCRGAWCGDKAEARVGCHARADVDFSSCLHEVDRDCKNQKSGPRWLCLLQCNIDEAGCETRCYGNHEQQGCHAGCVMNGRKCRSECPP